MKKTWKAAVIVWGVLAFVVLAPFAATHIVYPKVMKEVKSPSRERAAQVLVSPAWSFPLSLMTLISGDSVRVSVRVVFLKGGGISHEAVLNPNEDTESDAEHVEVLWKGEDGIRFVDRGGKFVEFGKLE